ncbi:MAG: inner membrane CreD family protein, partial [Armatimonadota bacterium]
VKGAGWTLKWISGNMIAAGSNIGIALPQKMNPGPLASNLSFFAPVSLLFFFSVLLILSAVKDIKLHPVHYLFISAGFFAFHLLFSYLVDHVTPLPSFLISPVVSLVLVISYMRLVVDWKFAMTHAALWQFVFLVLFAYAFFFEGYTGLTITIGAIITLGILMQLTGRVDWDEKLRSKPQSNPPPPTPLLPPGA